MPPKVRAKEAPLQPGGRKAFEDNLETEGDHAVTSGQVETIQSTDSNNQATVKETLEQEKDAPDLKRQRVKSVSNLKEIPQGKPKSGRVWKYPKKKFSSMVRDRSLCSSWEVKMKTRQEKKLLKSLAQQIKDEKQKEKEEKKRRREENLKRRLENERKAEVVQVIRNPAKLKRARKKQLRSIEKRETLKMSQAGKKMTQKNARVKVTEENEKISS